MKRTIYYLFAIILLLSADLSGKPKHKPKPKPKKNEIQFQGMEYVRYETEHFVLLCQDGREKKYADNLEKVWEETQKLIPELKNHFTPPEDNEISNKIFVFFFNDNYNYKSFGEWYAGLLSEKLGEKVAEKVKLTWDQSNIRMVSFPKGVLDKLKLEGAIGAAAYKIPPGGKYNPSLTHVTAALVNCIPKTKIPSWILIGYAYYLEIDICRKSATTYLSVDQMSQEGLSKDDIVRSKVFSSGRSWSKAVKKLFRDKKFSPPLIKDLANTTVSNLTPERAGFLYALTHFLINGKFEKGDYNEFMKKVYEGGKPQALLLEIYGFENIEDFEKKWYSYIKSSKFK